MFSNHWLLTNHFPMTMFFEPIHRWHYFQADMHFCAAKCCEDQTSSIDTVQGCVERCSVPLNKAQRYVHTELEGFQGRLQRCVMVVISTEKVKIPFAWQFLPVFQQCNDDIKNQMPPTPSDSEVTKYTAQFERCAIKCMNNLSVDKKSTIQFSR